MFMGCEFILSVCFESRQGIKICSIIRYPILIFQLNERIILFFVVLSINNLVSKVGKKSTIIII